MSNLMSRRDVLAMPLAGIAAAALDPFEEAAAGEPAKDLPQDPCALYPEVPGIACNTFRLPPEGLSSEARARALEQLRNYQSRRQSRFLGYQVNLNLAYEEDLRVFLNSTTNNIGDPFQTGHCTINTKWMERAVLDYYARLWNAKWPHNPNDPESYWGYVLTMGSTEGNLYGLWNGRDYLEGKCLLYESMPDASPPRLMCQQPIAPKDNPNAFTPVVLYSEDTHYSIIKAIRVLGMRTFYEVGTSQYPGQCPLKGDKSWPTEVPSTDGDGGPGTIDLDALARLVDFFAGKGHPILVNFNYGTTFKGAYDDVERAGDVLLPILRRHGLVDRVIARQGERTIKRDGFWFHVDGALGASYMPFLEMAHKAGKIKQSGPKFDFRLPYVHSITMSGHKWLGAPRPCGVYMSKTKYLLLPPSRPHYIGSRDTTLAGSRNGFSAMVLWQYLATHSYEAQIAKALRLERLAEYAYRKLKELESAQGPLWVARSPLSLAIWFKCPNPAIVFKYSLSTDSLVVDGSRRDYCHIYIMEHVTEALIDELVADLSHSDSFDRRDVSLPLHPSETESSGFEGFRSLVYVPETGRGMR